MKKSLCINLYSANKLVKQDYLPNTVYHKSILILNHDRLLVVSGRALRLTRYYSFEQHRFTHKLCKPVLLFMVPQYSYSQPMVFKVSPKLSEQLIRPFPHASP